MKTVAKTYKHEIIIKKSSFICRIFPVSNINEAKSIISKIATKYSDATHNCSAYIVDGVKWSDDDGEPSTTAGKPMLNVLEKNGLDNVLAIVTRYFGGIKLGAGGLVRAYSSSVIETLKIANIVNMGHFEIYELKFDYNILKAIEAELRAFNVTIINKSYEDKIKYNIAVLKENNNGINGISNNCSNSSNNGSRDVTNYNSIINKILTRLNDNSSNSSSYSTKRTDFCLKSDSNFSSNSSSNSKIIITYLYDNLLEI
ncbi:MAG: YigZ family protein [Methanobacteriaceae archaeon]